MAEKMLVFGAFHYDVAYRKTFEEYMPECIRIIDAGLDLLEERSDYVFNIEQVILLDAYWQRKPEQRERLKKFAAEKRLIFCPGMWTMPDGNIPSAESGYQNVLIGRRWLKERLDAEPGPICWMADIFGHHGQSPQIYAQSGYRLYMFERGQLEQEEAVDFRWEGIDGTELLTHWEKDTYYGLSLGLAWIGNRPEEWIADRLRKEVIEAAGRGEVVFSKVGGDFLVPRKEHLEFIARWNQQGRKPEIQFASPDRYIGRLEEQSGLPVIQAEFNPLLQGTYSTRIRLKQYNRRLENLAYALEALDVLAGKKTARDTAGLWRMVTRQQFHDIICGSLGDKVWKAELRTYLRETARAEKALRKRLGSGGVAGGAVLFNPLPYERTEVMDLPDGLRAVTLGAMETVSASGTPAASGLTPARVEGNVLDNGLVRAELDEYGRLSRLTDLTNGHVYEDKRFGYVHDVAADCDFGDPWVLHKGSVNSAILHTGPLSDPARMSCVTIQRRGLYELRCADSQCFNYPSFERSASESGATASIIAKYEINCTVRYTLGAGEKMLRIRVEHRLGGIRRRVRAVIPTGISGGTIRREIPAGWIVQPEGEYPAQNWLDYADETKGLCLLNKGLPGNNVTDGVMMLTLFRAVALEEPGIVPDYETGVTQEAEYALCPFAPSDPSYNPTRLGRLFNQPALVVPGAVVPAAKGISFRLETSGAEIMAVRPAEKQKRTVEVRFYDASGRGCTAELVVSRPLKSAEKITPSGIVLGPVEITGGNACRIALKPFEIVTLSIKY